MKITAVLLFVLSLHVSANTLSQTVSLTVKNAQLENIFNVIEKQTGFVVFYNRNLLKDATSVTIDAEKMPLAEFIQTVLIGQKLDFYIEDKTIFIRDKTPAAGLSPRLDLDAPPITGIVRGPDGKPLVGVNVVVKNTKKGVVTDVNGQFSIDAEPGSSLLLSSIGYNSQDIKIPETQTHLDILMAIATSPLDEVQIIAYGTTSQRLNTGNVGIVKSEDIGKQPVSNPLAAMIGRIPGVFISQATGVAGGGFNIQIRGKNSISKGNDPLYIVDGVPFSPYMPQNLASAILQPTNGSIDQGAGNPLNLIAPSEIETISVLKDADATSIYGSRGANGVVLITTKKGKSGKTTVGLNVSKGVGKVARKIDLLNTADYLHVRNEAFQNDGIIPDVNNAPDLKFWDTTRFTDWQEELIGGTSNYTDIQASLSGGSSNTQFLIGANFHRESSVFPGDFSDQKISMHANIKNVSANKKLSTTFSGFFLKDENFLPREDLTRLALYLPPNAPNLYNDDGSLNWANSTWSNPLGGIRRTYNAVTNNLISNLSLTYQLLQNLSLKTEAGYTQMQVKEIGKSPISANDPAGFVRTGSASFVDNNIFTWIIEPQINYQQHFGRSRFELLAGSTFQQSLTEGNIIDVSGYSSDALLDNIQAGSNPIFSPSYFLYKYNAIFGRFNYNWDNQYLINATIRRDGSSRFGNENKFHNFGSIAAAWVFSDNKFIKDKIAFLSFGKLRASYGTTGSDQIGDYSYFDLYQTSLAYQGIAGLNPQNIFNPFLAWEETKKAEGGLELGFLRDRFFFNFSYYQNRSSNQLLLFVLPTMTGFGFISSNFPATVQNYGWEFSLSTENVKSRKIEWRTTLNLTIQRNKLVSFVNIEESSYRNSLLLGQPITIKKVFNQKGVDPATGLYEFLDSAGNATLSPMYITDQTALANTAPKFYGGFSSVLTLGKFALDFTFQFAKQLGLHYRLPVPPGTPNNLPRSILERWQKVGDVSSVQKVTQDYSSPAAQAYYYSLSATSNYVDASYIRLRNLSISYQLPAKWMRKIKLDNLRVYASGQNLLTITHYDGLDPENNGGAILPPLRIVTFGIELSL